jgi:hypothetical protein
MLASLSCRGCADRVVGIDHHFGPIHAVSSTPTNYFSAYPAHSVVLVHKGPSNVAVDALRLPMQRFLNGLDERSLFQANPVTQP